MYKHILTILFLSVATWVSAQVTTDTIWNGKWDPNDPNCPCYKIQKQADEEYRTLQQEKQDSLQKIHRKEGVQMRKRMRQNKRRKKKKDCPQAIIIYKPETMSYHQEIVSSRTKIEIT